jgi:hypothetical protein
MNNKKLSLLIFRFRVKISKTNKVEFQNNPMGPLLKVPSKLAKKVEFGTIKEPPHKNTNPNMLKSFKTIFFYTSRLNYQRSTGTPVPVPESLVAETHRL